jgi:hypothetical protein
LDVIPFSSFELTIFLQTSNELDDVLDNPSRSRQKKDENVGATPEELDLSNLATKKAAKKFRRAERRGASTITLSTF